jgi:hypothetical protein
MTDKYLDGDGNEAQIDAHRKAEAPLPGSEGVQGKARLLLQLNPVKGYAGALAKTLEADGTHLKVQQEVAWALEDLTSAAENRVIAETREEALKMCIARCSAILFERHGGKMMHVPEHSEGVYNRMKVFINLLRRFGDEEVQRAIAPRVLKDSSETEKDAFLQLLAQAHDVIIVQNASGPILSRMRGLEPVKIPTSGSETKMLGNEALSAALVGLLLANATNTKGFRLFPAIDREEMRRFVTQGSLDSESAFATDVFNPVGGTYPDFDFAALLDEKVLSPEILRALEKNGVPIRRNLVIEQTKQEIARTIPRKLDDKKTDNPAFIDAVEAKIRADHPELQWVSKEEAVGGGPDLNRISREDIMAPHPYTVGLRVSQPTILKENAKPTLLATAMGVADLGGSLGADKSPDASLKDAWAEFREINPGIVTLLARKSIDELSPVEAMNICISVLNWIRTQVQFSLHQKSDFQRRIDNCEFINTHPRKEEILRELKVVYGNFDRNIVEIINRQQVIEQKYSYLREIDATKLATKPVQLLALRQSTAELCKIAGLRVSQQKKKDDEEA